MTTLNITYKKWAEVNQKALINFTVNEWKKYGSTLTAEQLVNWFHRLNLDFPSSCVVAFENEEIIGWIFLVYHSKYEVEINPWLLNGHPIIKKEYNDVTKAAELLIKTAIKNILSTEITRLDINFKNNHSYKPNLVDIYPSLGFELLEKSCHMRMKLDVLNSGQIAFSDEYEIIPIDKLDNDAFYSCFYTTFRNSQDNWLLDKTDDELRSIFDNDIIENRFQLINDASIALKHNEEVIAFSVVRQSHGPDNGHLSIMGVHPEYRKKGIAKNLINHMRNQLIKNKFKTASLNVDISNKPAFNLYKTQGFTEDWIQTNYTWKKGDRK